MNAHSLEPDSSRVPLANPAWADRSTVFRSALWPQSFVLTMVKSLPPDVDAVPAELIERRIYLIRGSKVTLDSDLAGLYQVPTFRLNEAVKRNAKRFPHGFVFQFDAGRGRSFDIANCDVTRGYALSHGLNTATPRRPKSFTLRVISVKSCSSPVAAISPSGALKPMPFNWQSPSRMPQRFEIASELAGCGQQTTGATHSQATDATRRGGAAPDEP